MSWGNLKDGLYLISQPSRDKGWVHYGILDVGNRLGLTLDRVEPVVVHLPPGGLRYDWLSTTGEWKVVKQIGDAAGAIARLRIVEANPVYDAVTNNCEHAARYIADGERRSNQVRWIGVFVGVAAVAFVAKASAKAA